MNPYLLMYNNHRSSAIISETKVTYCCDNKLECNTHLLLNDWIIIYGLLNSISNLTFKYPTNNTKLWINYPLIIFITDLHNHQPTSLEVFFIMYLKFHALTWIPKDIKIYHQYPSIAQKKTDPMLIWASPKHRILSNCWLLIQCSGLAQISTGSWSCPKNVVAPRHACSLLLMEIDRCFGTWHLKLWMPALKPYKNFLGYFRKE